MSVAIRAACLALAAYGVIGAGTLSAQPMPPDVKEETKPVVRAESKTTPRVGPTMDAARAGIAERAVKPDASTTVQPRQRLGAGQNIALMTVGGIALISGLIIGGDGGTIIAVSGLAVGLYGLYNYIK